MLHCRSFSKSFEKKKKNEIRFFGIEMPVTKAPAHVDNAAVLCKGHAHTAQRTTDVNPTTNGL